jgi:methyltransferase (TIGR00027 family)
MKDEKASFTAEATAIIRAAESAKPEGERICCDPYAKYFINPRYRNIGRPRRLTRFMMWLAMDRRYPGITTEVVLRTRYIDDYVRECVGGGIRQLVILGAGYDSRAYRIDGLKGNVNVFEVDHPATQKLKTERLKGIPGSFPDHVVHVSIDFHREKLDRRLSEIGYDKKLKTLFIWEGVAMYITAEAVDETLAFVVNNSGQGSSIIFNYLVEPVGDGPSDPEMSWWTLKNRQKWLEYAERIGEPFTFGIPEGGIEEFLCCRGFCQVVNATCKDMRNAFATGSNSKLKLTPWLATAHATVKPPE